MFGISPIGWVHTLGSLPAIPVAAYMFIRYGRIVPRSAPGLAYLAAMSIGGLTAFLVAKANVSYVIATLTMLALIVGYTVSRWHWLGRVRPYIETASLSFSALLLMVPTVTETLTRVPDGNPLAKSVGAPIVLGAQGTVLAAFILGLAAQTVMLWRRPAA